ncbi:hypothetical protein JB92DRAFT_2148165 [Gautieria morchelliformis]|nr:hypothetical protein JB92DRAFT_2148165 [Gautieria morchelliformis]
MRSLVRNIATSHPASVMHPPCTKAHQPFSFSIFNPLLQSENRRGKGVCLHCWSWQRYLNKVAIHEPYSHMPKADFGKLGYLEPIVFHKKVKDRAIRRYKNVGEL